MLIFDLFADFLFRMTEIDGARRSTAHRETMEMIRIKVLIDEKRIACAVTSSDKRRCLYVAHFDDVPRKEEALSVQHVTCVTTMPRLDRKRNHQTTASVECRCFRACSVQHKSATLLPGLPSRMHHHYLEGGFLNNHS
jgi:hypothetical protein